MALYLLDKTETVAFLYRWTNKITNMWYEGSRTASKCHPEDGYICSSPKVKAMILEDRNNWSRQILAIGPQDYIRELETKRLSNLDAKNDPMSFNKSNADGKFTTTGTKQHAAWLQKRIIALKGKQKPAGFGDMIRKSRTGITFDQTWCKNIGIASTGRIQSVEARRKNSEKNSGERNPSFIGYYVSPCGVYFDSPRKAAGEFNVSYKTIKNWAKQNKNGWVFAAKEIA